jgi:hypothetical protein
MKFGVKLRKNDEIPLEHVYRQNRAAAVRTLLPAEGMIRHNLGGYEVIVSVCRTIDGLLQRQELNRTAGLGHELVALEAGMREVLNYCGRLATIHNKLYYLGCEPIDSDVLHSDIAQARAAAGLSAASAYAEIANVHIATHKTRRLLTDAEVTVSLAVRSALISLEPAITAIENEIRRIALSVANVAQHLLPLYLAQHPWPKHGRSYSDRGGVTHKKQW